MQPLFLHLFFLAPLFELNGIRCPIFSFLSTSLRSTTVRALDTSFTCIFLHRDNTNKYAEGVRDKYRCTQMMQVHARNNQVVLKSCGCSQYQQTEWIKLGVWRALPLTHHTSHITPHPYPLTLTGLDLHTHTCWSLTLYTLHPKPLPSSLHPPFTPCSSPHHRTWPTYPHVLVHDTDPDPNWFPNSHPETTLDWHVLFR